MQPPQPTRLPQPGYKRLAVIAAIFAVLVLVACGGAGQKARDFEVVQYDGDTFRLSEETRGLSLIHI